ncbi:unnamed protein product, partial [Eretmochelys imbricata]
VLRLACHRELQCRQRGLRLRAQEETMDIPCDTVTMATTQGFTAVACITYSTPDSIINKTFLSEGNLPAGERLRNVQLNSRVVSGAIRDGRPLHLSRAVNLTLHHREAKTAKEEALCIHWKFIAGKGTYSPAGCTALHTNSTHTTCSCDHLSSFALLMGPTTLQEPQDLAILTFLLCCSIHNVMWQSSDLVS